MSEHMDVSRRLVAVFAADVEGYSRLMGADEVSTLRGLTERRAILDRLIADHRGRIANTAGTVSLPSLEAPLTRCSALWMRRLPWPKRTPVSHPTAALASALVCTSVT
jgi:class 3 adenylate cyclase